MRVDQAPETQRFGIEPSRLVAEGALYNITGFRDEAVTLRLLSRQLVNL